MLEERRRPGRALGQEHARRRQGLLDVPWFWSDQYELTLQMAGVPERGDITVERDVGAEARLLFHLDRNGRLVGVSGVGQPRSGASYASARSWSSAASCSIRGARRSRHQAQGAVTMMRRPPPGGQMLTLDSPASAGLHLPSSRKSIREPVLA
jgi:Reductase C-terminal